MDNKKNFIINIVTLIVVAMLAVSVYALAQTQDKMNKSMEKIQNQQMEYHNEIRVLMRRLDKTDDRVLDQNEKLEELKKNVPIMKTTYHPNGWEVTVTAYDLSVNSCGIPVGEEGYGGTASGFNLAGHTLESARCIAVDPDLIPLGSQVQVIFHDDYASQFNGIYTALDTGGAIEGNKIDLFMGDFGMHETADEVWEFGVRSATIVVL